MWRVISLLSSLRCVQFCAVQPRKRGQWQTMHWGALKKKGSARGHHGATVLAPVKGGTLLGTKLSRGEAGALQPACLVQLLPIQEALARTWGSPTSAVHNLCSFYIRAAPTGKQKDLLLHIGFCWCLRTCMAAHAFVLLNCAIQVPSFK